jgi:hypothetical protein
MKELLRKNNSNYNETLDWFCENFAILTVGEKNFLQDFLLFCAIDFLTTMRNETLRNPTNPYFYSSNRLEKIKMILDSDEDCFYYLYDNINNRNYIENRLQEYKPFFEDIHLPEIQYWNEKFFLTNLDQYGISIHKDYFPLDYIDLLRRESLNLLNEKESIFRQKRWENEGRHRIFLEDENIPDLFFKLMTNPHITEYISTTIRCQTICTYMQIEHLSHPTPYTDFKWWHIDNLANQIKVFIPLSTITKKDGPLLYIPSTHKFSKMEPFIKSFIHYIYVMSDFLTKPTTGIAPSIIQSLGLTIESATANLGDIVFFNSTFIHTASQCHQNHERLNLVLVFNKIETNRNRLFRNFKTFYNF